MEATVNCPVKFVHPFKTLHPFPATLLVLDLLVLPATGLMKQDISSAFFNSVYFK